MKHNRLVTTTLTWILACFLMLKMDIPALAGTMTEGDWTYEESADGNIQIIGYTGNANTLVIPSKIYGKNVTGIADAALKENANVTSIRIPTGVTSIGAGAFEKCSNLTSIGLPFSITSIGENAFSSCSDNLVLNVITGSFAKTYAQTHDIAYTESTELFCNHIYTSTITRQATCTTAGATTYTCSNCGDNFIESVDKTIHNYQPSIIKATPAQNGCESMKCTGCGSVDEVRTHIIYAPQTISLSQSSYAYTGKSIKPYVTVTDSIGNCIEPKNYKVSYNKNKNVGEASVTVTFRGEYYSGKLKKTFSIKPKATYINGSELSTDSITINWKKKTKQVTGYQIQYTTKKSFKKAKSIWIKKAKTTSKKITGLKDNKKYNLRIRTYKTIKKNGKSKKIYSEWSGTYSVTTLKKPDKPVLNPNPVGAITAGPYELYVLHTDNRGYPYFYGKWGGTANMDGEHLTRTDTCIDEMERYYSSLYAYEAGTLSYDLSYCISWKYIGLYDGVPVVVRYIIHDTRVEPEDIGIETAGNRLPF